MASTDYYRVLEVPRSADQDDIKAAFRRLARVRHPDKNLNAPNATADFQLLNQAYDTLKDPAKRREYNNQYKPQPSRQDEAGGTRTQNTSWCPRHPSETPALSKTRQCLEEMTVKINKLDMQSRGMENELSTTRTDLDRTRAKLESLQEEEEVYQKDSKSWARFFWRPTTAQQEKENRESTSRRTGMLVVEARLERLSTKVKNEGETLARLKREVLQMRTRREITRKSYNDACRAEATRREDQEREKAAKAERERQSRKRAEAARAREVEIERMRREEATRRQEDLQRRNEAQIHMSRTREQGQTSTHGTASGPRRTANSEIKPEREKGRQPGSCRHRGWWNRKQEAGVCQHCKRWQRQFFFQCPGCQMQACANCRATLKC